MLEFTLIIKHSFKVFPESDQKLCQFHGCQAMWRWLWEGKHNIALEDRHPLITLYRAIMYATDQQSAGDCYEHVSYSLWHAMRA